MKMPDRRGFTLVELIVALGVFVLVFGIIYGIFVSSRRVQTAEEQLVGLAQEARGGLEQMVREVRMTGAMTTGVVTPCNIVVMGSNEIEVEGDFDVDHTLDRVRYFYDASTKTLNRWEYAIANDVGWNAPATRCAESLNGAGVPAGVTAAIQKEEVAYDIESLAIAYYDQNGQVTGIANDVTKISMTIKAKGAVSTTGAEPPVKTLTVDVMMPNLGVGKFGTDTTPPDPPTGVTATDLRVCGYFRASWNANTEPDLNGYVVSVLRQNLDGTWPAPGPGNWVTSERTFVITVLQTEFSRFDLGITDDSTYRVLVRAFDASGNSSGYSDAGPLLNPASDVTISDNINPNVVTNLAGTTDDDAGTITLTWDRGQDTDVGGRTSDASGRRFFMTYDVQRDTSAAGPFGTTISAGIANNVLTIDDSSVNQCQTYFYRVQSTDKCGRTSLSAVYGLQRTNPAVATGTSIINTTVAPPQTFEPGGGTTVADKPNYSYAYFTGTASADALTNAVAIAFEKGTSTICPEPPASLTAQNTVAVLASPPGGGYSDGWDGMFKGNKYRFSAFAQNQCGYWSPALAATYCVDKCTDSGTYPGNLGLGDACVMDITDPIQVRVCDRLEFNWRTKELDNVTPPAACTAYGNGATYDFFADEGDGGYRIRKAEETDDVVNNGEVYTPLDGVFATGPDNPIWWSDTDYDGGMNNCIFTVSNNRANYRDRCSYRIKINAVDCAMNESSAAAFKQNSRVSPGIINAPSSASYPVAVGGVRKNKVVFTVQNTAAAELKWHKGYFEWLDAAARLTKVEIYNSVEGGASWKTMWSSSSNSTGVPSTTTLVFDTPYSIAASPVLNPGNPTLDNTKKAQVRLTFYTTAGVGQRMDDLNEKIKVTPYWVNKTTNYGSTDTEKMCPTESGLGRARFEVTPTPPPSIGAVYQNPPNTSGLASGDTAITTAPTLSSLEPQIGRNKAYDNYIINGPGGVNDPVNPTIRATVTPFSASYPVAQCGDTGTNRGVVLYYAMTGFSNTVPPVPNNGDDLLTPTNFTKVSMCNESFAGACSGGSCTYQGSLPTLQGKRFWYYIAAADSSGNYSVTPIQQSDAFDTAYNFDTCGAIDTFKYMAPSRAYSPITNAVTLTTGWTSRGPMSGTYCQSGFDDKYTVGSKVTATVTSLDPVTGMAVHLTTRDDCLARVQAGSAAICDIGAEWFMQGANTENTVQGCSGCFTCESGFDASGISSTIWKHAPPLRVAVKYEKCGFIEKTCTWDSSDGLTWTGGGAGCY